MKNIVICISLTLVALVSLGCDRSTAPGSSASERAIGTVDLTVDFGGEGETIQVAIPVSDGSTVFTTLKRADQHGDLELEAGGSGETAFVNGINGVAGNPETGRFWFFYVNDELAKQGCGAVEVGPADKISWRYQEQPADFDE